jgi:hypothetical protein
LLNRADVLIAIQSEEAEALRELAPNRDVIRVGVDFKLTTSLQPPATWPVVLLVGSGNPNNVKGLKDFLRFAWPLVRRAVPEVELRVVGAVGEAVEAALPGVRILGLVDDLEPEYSAARVIINPAVAGTGLKIKTVEALCHLRPAVVWPSGVDGIAPELRSFCRVARNWFEFAQHVIELAGSAGHVGAMASSAPELAQLFAPQKVYAPLSTALDEKARLRNAM